MPQRQNFQTIPHHNISKGIDQRSSPNAVQPGFAEDMRNMDTNSMGFVEKRKGYQGYRGNLPLRMEKVELNAGLANFEFNVDINLLITPSSPVVVYGNILQAGIGTLTSNGTAVTGSGTTFTTVLRVGSVLIADTGESQVVVAIDNDTSLTTGAAFSPDLAGNAFTHRTVQEYCWTEFINESRKTVAANTSRTYTVNHGIGTTATAVALSYAPNADDLDNFFVYPESIVNGTDVDETSITIDNTENASSKDFFILLEDTDNTDVVTYRGTISETLVSGTATITIPVVTHTLPNLHIIPFLYAETSAGEFEFILPDSLIITAAGDVVITVDNADNITVGGTTTFDGQIVLIDVPGSQALENSISSGDGQTIQFSDITDPFNFFSLYTRDGAGIQTQVIPNTMFFDESTETLTATFDIDTSKNLKLVYNPAIVKSNVISVDYLTDYPNIIDDLEPAVSLWGIPHTDIIYQDKVPKGSWTNSLEEYSSQGINKIVTGMGGNLYEEIDNTQSEVSIPSYFVDMRRRTDEAKSIGPFFGTVGNKSRGIESSLIDSSGVQITNITNNGDATATLGLRYGAKYGSLSQLITTASTTGNDKIDVRLTGNPEYTGSFDIVSVSETLTYGSGSTFGISTATKNTSTQATFVFDSIAEAATFHSTYLSDGQIFSWKDGSDTVYIMTVDVGGSLLLDPSGTTNIVVTTAAVIITGTEIDFTNMKNTLWSITDNNVTMEDADQASSITISVPGLASYIPNETDVGALGLIFSDSIIMSALNEELVSEDLPFLVNDTIVGTLFTGNPIVIGVDRAVASSRRLYMDNLLVNVLVPAGAQINSSRTTDSHVLTSVAKMVRGDTVSALGYEREFQIINVDPTTNTITLDESILLSDDPASRAFISVTGRWLTVEAPSLNVRPLSYFDDRDINDQDRLRGVSITDSIFYTNYNDDIMKYDGSSIYRAGLPNWQPRTHSWVDQDEAGIPVPQFQYIAAFLSDTGTSPTIANTLRFASMPDLTGIDEVYLVGDDGANSAETVKIILVNESEKFIQVKRTAGNLVDSTTRGHILIPQQAAYYFKLQMIDRNNNLVASAVTDYQESIVEMTRSGTITHRLTGLPKFDRYDYARVDLLIFRSKLSLNASPPFYQVKRIPIDFELAKATNSIIITDTVPDEALSPIPDDTVSIALKGAELPISSDQPARAKYLETVDSRLILGNVKGYNRADITLTSDSGITEDNVLGNAVIRIAGSVVTNDLTFEFKDLVDGAGTALNATDNLEITSINFTSSTSQFEMTASGSVGYDLTGKYIQLSSFFMDAAGAGLYTNVGRTRNSILGLGSDLGRVIGWWKIASHVVTTNDTLVVEYTHGIDTNFLFSGTTNPMYMTIPDAANSNIPVLAAPYAISAINRIIEDVVYDDTTTAFRFTSAVNRGVRDLKQAFNRIMVEESEPWAYALSGATEGNGRILFESAIPGRTLTVTISEGGGTDLKIFVNNARRVSGTAVAGRTTIFPSRLLISSPNFPEMFDNPFGSGVTDSDSLLDVNADDGQEITGMANFFADSTNANGALQSTLIVFKNKSVYAVDVTTRSLQKLESMGQGCTIPDSISATQGGIMFANQSGVYKVDRNLRITYAGKWLERYWKDSVGSSVVEAAAVGFTDGVNRKYKLSIPLGTSTKNSETVVLDYIVEDQVVDGSWTIYDNIAATAWTQTNLNSYFSNYVGQVFGLRQVGDATDFRDDASGITASFTYGAQSFGDSGSRSVVNRVISHLRAATNLTGLELTVATDMSTDFEAADTISFTGTNPKLHSIATSIPKRHGLFHQVKYTHTTKDETLVLSGIDFKVQGLGELGIPQAND